MLNASNVISNYHIPPTISDTETCPSFVRNCCKNKKILQQYFWGCSQNVCVLKYFNRCIFFNTCIFYICIWCRKLHCFSGYILVTVNVILKTYLNSIINYKKNMARTWKNIIFIKKYLLQCLNVLSVCVLYNFFFIGKLTWTWTHIRDS